jgi:hypothetical protein
MQAAPVAENQSPMGAMKRVAEAPGNSARSRLSGFQCGEPSLDDWLRRRAA